MRAPEPPYWRIRVHGTHWLSHVYKSEDEARIAAARSHYHHLGYKVEVVLVDYTELEANELAPEGE